MNSVNKQQEPEFEEGAFKGVTSEKSDAALIRDRDLLSIVFSPDNPEGTILIVFKEKLQNFDLHNDSAFLKLRQNQTSRIVVLNEAIPSGSEVINFAESIIAELESKGLKRITLIGIEDGASVVQALTILEPRLIRRAVLIDPNSRVHPTFFSRTIDWIEQFLPVGLPFRAASKEFDSRPFVHRIRCPILVVATPTESFYRVRESEHLASKIPNCYLVKTAKAPLEDKVCEFSDEFIDLFETFQKSPVKRPQKNR